MAKEPEILNKPEINPMVAYPSLDLQTARKALSELRKIASDLPPIDAVAIVRESRQTESKVE